LNKLSEAREAANALANALNSLYAGGPGSKQTVEYWFPEGAVEVYAHPDGDGIESSDGIVPPNGRMDVQVLLDFDGDGTWDNTRNSVVLVDTLLPSRWYENGDERENAWVRENGITIQDYEISLDSAFRTHHRTTLEYQYQPVIENGVLLGRWDLSQEKRDKAKFKTTLFGVKVRFKVDNEDAVIEAELELKNSQEIELEEEGTNFTLSATVDNVTVTAVVDAPVVELLYGAVENVPPYPRRIIVSDTITERA
jgi:hypothetical protein